MSATSLARDTRVRLDQLTWLAISHKVSLSNALYNLLIIVVSVDENPSNLLFEAKRTHNTGQNQNLIAKDTSQQVSG